MNDDGFAIRIFDAVKALAFIGDLSMGQPTDHSSRTAWLAARLAHASGLDESSRTAAVEASLLRWSGCTANASGFTDVLGDDVAGREAMLALRPDWAGPLEALGGVSVALTPLTQIHCEVSSEVARIMGLERETEATLRHMFEKWDGSGMPDRLAGAAVPDAVFVVWLAGDLEIFSRVYGLERALKSIAHQADARYPQRLATIVIAQASQWLDALERTEAARADNELMTPLMRKTTSAELIADVIDLKLPWMTGFSRAVAATAATCCERLALDSAAQDRLYCAGLIHGIGRAAVPNALWQSAGRLSASAWEKVRLVPYWTARAGKQTAALAQVAELASYAYERLDGSGYFRGVGGEALTLEARILAASVAWVALRSPRPSRDAMSADDAEKVLRAEADQGRFDSDVVDALIVSGPTARGRTRSRQQAASLSARETDVLRAISLGASNKEIARELTLSPSTVRTHVESVFRKLGCSTRAAATLKGSTMGLL